MGCRQLIFLSALLWCRACLAFLPQSKLIHFNNNLISPVSASSKNEGESGLGDDGDLNPETRELFDGMTRDMFGGMPRNPFASRLESIKNELYEDEDLLNVLSMHSELSDSFGDEFAAEVAADGSASLSLHDIVLEAIGEIPSVDASVNVGPNGPNLFGPQIPSFSSPLVSDADLETKEKISKIRAIASDVDGTLLSSRQTLHPRTRLAVKRAIDESSVKDATADGRRIEYFFPATGKSRKGALDSLGFEIGSLIAERNVPGVYLQGLYCVDGEGNVVFEKKLAAEATAAAEKLVSETGISIVAYDGDDLYTTDATEIVVHLHEHYGEPLPRLLPSTEGIVINLSEHGPGMHKLLLMDDDVEKLKKIVRPQLEKLAKSYGACVTQALPTMLELLPGGCSKAIGVQKLCDALGIDMETELLALGDAENDAEMLQLAAVGVAMGNGCPLAKNSADFVVEETNDDGGAGVAMEIFAFSGSK
eukprot:CAMPEP_0183306100 /NCGR_PEP_ID=MMETSP0160_2-20130417/10630_1 /TAXON_ID=2839 ORGANISM="Odontella Sinensis, Strain Grunow 1884" /NCGR_SAMPLE_ID=MMETSP0160_2 /ASSEMBLY_ACC=CAM_ASM_000250 /LENGTH=477 /DNA_ID=CAMNT_0025469417 /DNA_START=114 /DNA_END=1547 /DNA_ORIENTATION=+